MTPDQLASYAQVMKNNGVLKASGEAEEGEDFCIELHPSVFEGRAASAAEVPAGLGAGEPKCACGHLQETEHQNGLCIVAACPVSVCHPEATKPPA